MMLINTPNHENEMVVTPTTYNRPWAWCFPICFCDLPSILLAYVTLSFHISKLDVHLGLMDHIIPSHGLGVLQLCKAYEEEREPPLLLERGVFERQYLMLWEIDTSLYQSCVGYYKPIRHILLLAIIYTMLDVIKANPKPVFHIVGGAILLQSFLCRSIGAMFASSDLGVI